MVVISAAAMPDVVDARPPAWCRPCRRPGAPARSPLLRRAGTATGRPALIGRGSTRSGWIAAARAAANSALASPASGLARVLRVAVVGDVVGEGAAERLADQVQEGAAAGVRGPPTRTARGCSAPRSRPGRSTVTYSSAAVALRGAPEQLRPVAGEVGGGEDAAARGHRPLDRRPPAGPPWKPAAPSRAIRRSVAASAAVSSRSPPPQ